MKAVLVIDKPKSCVFCPLIDGETGECREGGIIEDNENPTYCPLKPLPQKHKEVVRTTYDGTITNQVELQFTAGYNACIDELLGEE